MSSNNQTDPQKKGDDSKRIVQLAQDPGTFYKLFSVHLIFIKLTIESNR